MKSTIVLILLTITSGIGQEITVNTNLPRAQRDPAIASDSSGAMIVVWKSERLYDSLSLGDIIGRRLDPEGQPIGPEFIVNTITAGDQEKPSVAMSASGNVIVVWTSHTNTNDIYDIKGRVYKSGNPLGNEFLVNSTTLHTQSNPSVAMDLSGNFIVAWDSWYQDGSGRGVYAQRYDSAGNIIGAEFRVNVVTLNSQTKPVVKYFNDSRFVVVWESWKQDHSALPGYGVYGRIFNADGTPSTGEIQINSYVHDYQWYADVETFSDGSFIVAWCSWEQDGSDGGIYFRRFSALGIPLTDEILANKTTTEYQWLPRIKKLNESEFAIVWSSWKQDGSREGIYARYFTLTGKATSFETRVNDYTESFQWEPDFVVTAKKGLFVTWSSWGKTNNDYDIMVKQFSPLSAQGYVATETYTRSAGTTTASILVHVIDSTQLTGGKYEVTFDSIGVGNYRLNVRNTSSNQTMISQFPVNKGEQTFYLTGPFDGVAVELKPEFDLDVDYQHSHFKNLSGSNISFAIVAPTIGTRLVPPIDAVLVWGSSDTLSSGQYSAPMDTAINTSGQRVVVIPFTVRNCTDNNAISVLVADANSNKRYDFGERILFLTPPPYRKASNNTFVQISTPVSQEHIVWPSQGDTIFIYTTRPLTAADRFQFTTAKSAVLGAPNLNVSITRSFSVAQNYPNPFNPSTSIQFSLSVSSHVSLKVFDILGKEVATLVNGTMGAGSYTAEFDARVLSSGPYFYTLRAGSYVETKKMMLTK